MADFKLLKKIQDAMKPKTGTEPYDTTATVTRIEGSTAWVHIPGGVDETPVEMTINAAEGDAVRVRVSGGQAWLMGNNTAPPTDDTTARHAVETADTASEKAQAASEAAEIATQAAESAQVSAENASEYASRALVNLSTVQSVVETLTWITEHGTMALTTDTEIDPTHVYFVVDAEGDYVVGTTHYSVVTEPRVEDISTYYELSIDESLNNFVATHLAVTNEGLWILPATTGYKILIATGNGTTYTAAGTYIIDASGNTVAKFGADVVIGNVEDTHANIQKTKYTIYAANERGVIAEFGVSNNATTGIATVTESEQTRAGVRIDDVVYRGFSPAYMPSSIVECLVGDTDLTDSTHIAANGFIYNSNFTTTTVATVTYRTTDPVSFAKFNKASTVGPRAFASGSLSKAEGNDSAAFGIQAYATGDNGAFAEGGGTLASGDSSHAEGASTTASGNCAHAEGNETVASGPASHAEGSGCTAAYADSHAAGKGTKTTWENQTAVGKYNKDDTSSLHLLFVVGNGTSDQNRADAFVVREDGVTEAIGGLAIKNGSGQTDPPFYLCLNETFANGGMVGYLTKANMKKAMLADDSDWQTATLTSEFTTYSTANPPANVLKYRKTGKTVLITGVIKPTDTIAGGSTTHTIFTLPSGYRPPQTVYALMHGSVRYYWLLVVNTNGTVTFSRYGGEGSYVDVDTGTWLPIHITFMID